MSSKEKLEVGDLVWFVQKNQSKVMDFVGLDHICFKSLLEKNGSKVKSQNFSKVSTSF
jgi:hypothetical protein